jgi:hypothetical protein
VPEPSDGVTWPSVIARANDEQMDDNMEDDKPERTAVDVATVLNPWEELPSGGAEEADEEEEDPEYAEAVAYATAEALQEVNQHFFIRNVEVFKDNMLAGCDEDDDEDEDDDDVDDE